MRLLAKAITVVLGTSHALDSLTLEVPAGAQLVVWGEAGSGKTTLLKCLAGLIRPTAGAVFWGDERIDQLDHPTRRTRQARIGMVFQSDALFDSLNVLENVALPLVKRGVAREDAEARAHATLDRVQLTGVHRHMPDALSGGMRKRVGIARAIVADPEVLLADDPFAGLDPRTEQAMAQLLVEVSRRRTLIVAMPDPSDFMPQSLAIRLEHGRVAH